MRDYTRSLRRKRTAISANVEEASPIDSSLATELKRMPSDTLPPMNRKRSRLEALPKHLLIKVLCKVDHEDFEQLYRVSKTIKEAAVMAKKSQFEFVTPKKNTFAAFETPMEMEDECFLAPLRKYEPRLISGRNLARITVALFSSPDEDKWPMKKVVDASESLDCFSVEK